MFCQRAVECRGELFRLVEHHEVARRRDRHHVQFLDARAATCGSSRSCRPRPRPSRAKSGALKGEISTTGTLMRRSRGRRSSISICAAKSAVAPMSLRPRARRVALAIASSMLPICLMYVCWQAANCSGVWPASCARAPARQRAAVAGHPLGARKYRQAIDGDDAGDQIGMLGGESQRQACRPGCGRRARACRSCASRSASRRSLRQRFERRARHGLAPIEAGQRHQIDRVAFPRAARRCRARPRSRWPGPG